MLPPHQHQSLWQDKRDNYNTKRVKITLVRHPITVVPWMIASAVQSITLMGASSLCGSGGPSCMCSFCNNRGTGSSQGLVLQLASWCRLPSCGTSKFFLCWKTFEHHEQMYCLPECTFICSS